MASKVYSDNLDYADPTSQGYQDALAAARPVTDTPLAPVSQGMRETQGLMAGGAVPQAWSGGGYSPAQDEANRRAVWARSAAGKLAEDQAILKSALGGDVEAQARLGPRLTPQMTKLIAENMRNTRTREIAGATNTSREGIARDAQQGLDRRFDAGQEDKKTIEDWKLSSGEWKAQFTGQIQKDIAGANRELGLATAILRSNDAERKLQFDYTKGNLSAQQYAERTAFLKEKQRELQAGTTTTTVAIPLLDKDGKPVYKDGEPVYKGKEVTKQPTPSGKMGPPAPAAPPVAPTLAPPAAPITPGDAIRQSQTILQGTMGVTPLPAPPVRDVDKLRSAMSQPAVAPGPQTQPAAPPIQPPAPPVVTAPAPAAPQPAPAEQVHAIDYGNMDTYNAVPVGGLYKANNSPLTYRKGSTPAQDAPIGPAASPQGAPAAPAPLPASKSQAVVGQIYTNAAGRKARWNGTAMEPVQ